MTTPDINGADSVPFVKAAIERMQAAGYGIGNIDITVICERPKLSPQNAGRKPSTGIMFGILLDLHEGLCDAAT